MRTFTGGQDKPLDRMWPVGPDPESTVNKVSNS